MKKEKSEGLEGSLWIAGEPIKREEKEMIKVKLEKIVCGEFEEKINGLSREQGSRDLTGKEMQDMQAIIEENKTRYKTPTGTLSYVLRTAEDKFIFGKASIFCYGGTYRHKFRESNVEICISGEEYLSQNCPSEMQIRLEKKVELTRLN